jgi:hypothetical protein
VLGSNASVELSLLQSKKNDMPYFLLCFLFNKIEEAGGTGSSWKWELEGVGAWGTGGTNNVYKCKQM